jgi:hypothetical protein
VQEHDNRSVSIARVDEMDSKALPGIVAGGNLDEPTTTRIVIDPSQDVGGVGL